MQLYKVGGCIRDELLGIRSKDIDYAVEIDDVDPGSVTVDQGFDLMRSYLQDQGFQIFLETPQYATIRAQFPEGTSDISGVKTADFVLCRKEGPYSDGRRPDWVSIGTVEDDLARRDLTVNALAQKLGHHEIIDLFGGEKDLEDRLLRFVGSPQERITEDALRIMRAVRFTVTKGFRMHEETRKAICSPTSISLLRLISEERRAAELDSMFKFSTMTTLDVLGNLPRPLVDAMFTGRVRLSATLKKETRR